MTGKKGLTAPVWALTTLTLAMAPASWADSPSAPEQWPGYRLQVNNNAVFAGGDDALPETHFKTSGQVRATPVIVGNRLYVGNHETGGMQAFDLESGKMLWGSEEPDFRIAPNWIHSDMIYADDSLFVGYGNRMFQSEKLRGTGESGVMAVDPDTGRKRWQYSTRGEVMPAPVHWQDLVLITTGDAHLIALDAESGKEKWSMKLPGWVSMSSPHVKDDVLYVGALNSVVAIDLKKRERLWTFKETSSFTDVPPAISHDGLVYISGAKPYTDLTKEEKKRWSDEARQSMHFLYALDAKSGKLRWKKLLGHGPKINHNTSGAPTVVDGHVYVGSPYTQSMFSYDAKSGDKEWEYRIGAGIKGAPAVKDGLVFFGDTDGYLHVVDADSGHRPTDKDDKPIKKRRLGGSASDEDDVALAPAGPVLINQNLYASSQDGNVYRISLPEWLDQD